MKENKKQRALLRLLTFDGVEKVLDRLLVQPESLFVVFVLVLLSGFCHQIDCFLQKDKRERDDMMQQATLSQGA